MLDGREKVLMNTMMDLLMKLLIMIMQFWIGCIAMRGLSKSSKIFIENFPVLIV